MNPKFIIPTALLVMCSLVSYSQAVASIDSPEIWSESSSLLISKVSYDIVDASTNATFKSLDYSASKQKLSLSTIEAVKFITIIKEGDIYLNNMPVLANSLNLSLENYEVGDYQLHLTVEGKAVPTIIEVTKS